MATLGASAFEWRLIRADPDCLQSLFHFSFNARRMNCFELEMELELPLASPLRQ
jgi:hypothetical protein